MSYFPTPYQEFIFTSRYARWNEEAQRRETWPEAIERYVSFMTSRVQSMTGYRLPSGTIDRITRAIYQLHVMPSMRAFSTAGPALDRDHISNYNCSALDVNRVESFDETMYILMCGTGVGFSVEQRSIQQLPLLPTSLTTIQDTIVVGDSKIGWASAFRQLMMHLYQGHVPGWDTSQVRPAGAKLVTFGGRASGPAPLVKLFEHAVKTFQTAIRLRQQKLTPIQCHSIMTMIGEVVVSGGVRRSAMISLSDPDDVQMRDAKTGRWWTTSPHFALANNSAVWERTPDTATFMREWLALMESGSGERGILNRNALKMKASSGRRSPTDFLVNPCSEISLRSQQTCNLTECIVRPDDSYSSLAEKVEIAAIIGTMQACFTDFQYLDASWRANCEEERLLGVSLSGIYDHVGLSDVRSAPRLLGMLKEVAVETNKQWARKFGINQAAAVTCVKPSGTVSQLANCASGIHPRYAPYYIRRVRANMIEPVAQMLIDQGISYEPDAMLPGTVVFAFPQQSHTQTTNQTLEAVDHLNLARAYNDHWCEHNVSLTVSVRPHEWIDVGQWVYKNFDEMSCASFLPLNEHTYAQAPYEEISAPAYEAMRASMPAIRWEELSHYEAMDTTTSAAELACAGGACELP